MTKLGMKRTIPQLPLKSKTPLGAKKGLNKMSDRSKEELKIWLGVKAERIQKLHDKFGYVPCEHCKERIIDNNELYQADAHHNNHNRRDNSFENCRILKRVCHTLIEDKNIKDVLSLL